MDIMMKNKIYDLITLDSMDNLPYEIKDALSHKILEVANLFGFTYLRDDLKIKLFICEKSDFENKMKDICINSSEEIVAFQYNINCVFVLDYQNLNTKYSQAEYISVIIHECVHVLQFYYSKISSKQYVWLYESIACYLSGQKNKRDIIDIESWDVFESDFYNMKDCYGVAYRFGAALFQSYLAEAMVIIKYPEMYKERLIELYNSTFP